MGDIPNSSSKKNRTNLFIDNKLLAKIDYITGMNFAIKGVKASRTDIVNEALLEYVSKYEKTHGEIKI
jgi:metal-responsive CopG/Arc/MetJ family transcriptional regulator